MDSRSDRSISPEPPHEARRRCRQRSSCPCCDTDGADRISGLPDNALLKILAGTRTAAHAGGLSRQWRGLWRRLPEIHLHGLAPDAVVAALAQAQHFTPYARKLQEIVQLPDISVFELCLLPHGHGFGSTVLKLLGIFTAIQSLQLVIERIMMEYETCRPNCHCDHPPNWRSQNITLTGLKEVEIKNFEASEDEVNLLELVFGCAPLLRRVTLRVSRGFSPRELEWKYNLFKAHPSVRPYVYDSCGEKMEYNSRSNRMLFYDDVDRFR